MLTGTKVAKALVIACILGTAMSSQAQDAVHDDLDPKAVHEQVEAQIREKLTEGWLNPACLLAIVNDGAFVVSDKGELKACSDKLCKSLVDVGLLKKGKATSPDMVTSRFVVTEMAKPFLAPHQKAPEASKLCFAKTNLSFIVSTTTDGEFGGNFNTLTTQFKTELMEVAPWAANPQVVKAFPTISQTGVGIQASAIFSRFGSTLTIQVP